MTVTNLYKSTSMVGTVVVTTLYKSISVVGTVTVTNLYKYFSVVGTVTVTTLYKAISWLEQRQLLTCINLSPGGNSDSYYLV